MTAEVERKVRVIAERMTPGDRLAFAENTVAIKPSTARLSIVRILADIAGERYTEEDNIMRRVLGELPEGERLIEHVGDEELLGIAIVATTLILGDPNASDFNPEDYVSKLAQLLGMVPSG